MTTTSSPDPDLSHVGPRDKAEILAQALLYIRKFHGKTPWSSNTVAMR